LNEGANESLKPVLSIAAWPFWKFRGRRVPTSRKGEIIVFFNVLHAKKEW